MVQSICFHMREKKNKNNVQNLIKLLIEFIDHWPSIDHIIINIYNFGIENRIHLASSIYTLLEFSALVDTFN